MASAFDDLTASDADYIRKRLLAGDKMAAIRAVMPGITNYRMRKLRDEVFGSLTTDPEAVKALANGPMLNANQIVRYTHSRKVIQRVVREQQTEMFGAA